MTPVRLDKWQNIVGVGWGGIRSLLMVNASYQDGDGAEFILRVGKSTLDELAAKDMEFTGVSTPTFEDQSNLNGGYGFTLWTRSRQPIFTPPEGTYRTAMNLAFAKELAAPVIVFRTSVFYGYADAEEEQGATETGSISFVYFNGVLPDVLNELTRIDGANGFDPAEGDAFLRYDQAFTATVSGTRFWSHGPGDAANRGDFGTQRSFYVNYTINALTGEVGDPFFTSTLDG